MERFQNTFCRICLLDVRSDENSRVIDETIIEVLDVLLLKLNVEEKDKSIMCNTCCKELFAAFQFKAICMDTEDAIFPYVNSKNGAPVDLIEIYLKERGKEHLRGVLDDEKICRLCMQIFPCDFTFVNDVGTDLIQKYVPEINFSVTLKPVICTSCLCRLHTHNDFLKHCSRVDEHFKKSYSDENTAFCIKTEEIVIKSDETQLDSEIPPDESENLLKAPISQRDTRHTQFGRKIRRNKDCSDVESYTGDYQTIQTSTVSDHQLENESFSNARKYKSDRSSNLKAKYKNKSIAAMEIYECEMCNFKTKHRGHLARHRTKHNNIFEAPMYKCGTCNYETKLSGRLERHELQHRNISEIRLYKCDTCNFETRRKDSLTRHMLIHKGISEPNMYKCDQCNFETKYRRSFANHSSTHSENFQVQMYKCDKCNFQTKYKGNLGYHELTHKDVSEVQMYKCDTCSYGTRRKGHLRIHQLRHKYHSELQMIKGEKRNFETKPMRSLVVNSLTSNSLEVQMYKCDKCNFQTKYKGNLVEHVIIHKDSSEVQIYKCHICKFETKRKANLRIHQLRHKYHSKAQMDK